MRGQLVAVAATAGLLAAAGNAGAAARRFAWLDDTDVLPERSVELEWWVWERPDTAVWFVGAAVVGINDHLELTLPFEVGLSSDGERARASYGAELRLRLASPDAARAGPVVPLLRAGAHRVVQTDEGRFELFAALSIDLGRARVVVEAGGYATTAEEQLYAAGGAGISVRVTDELRVGAELRAELSLDERDEEDRWVSAGPNLAWTHGRLWVTAALPIGLHATAPEVLPRILWGVAF